MNISTVDGFYTIKFNVPGDQGYGVVYVRDGHVFGGDSSFTLTGALSLNGTQVSGVITSKRYSPMLAALLGLNNTINAIQVDGDIATGLHTLTATVNNQTITVALTKV